MKSIYFVFALVVVFGVVDIDGHGRLMKPAGRASLWRFPEFRQFNPVPDYNDNQGFCGGFYVQYYKNGGKCGICGDPYDAPQPREHEAGGKFGKGIITGNYTSGQIIDVSVELTASHLGYFEFRLCPHENPSVPVTQECLDKHLLEIADGSGTKFPVPTYDARFYDYSLKLPEGLTCENCVLQWHYNVGNSYGHCEDGSFQLGCGDQETFRGCADITIT